MEEHTEERSHSGHHLDLRHSPFLPLTQADIAAVPLETVMGQMRASEINFLLSHFWDAGYRVALGDGCNGWLGSCVVDSFDEAAAWFQQYVPVFWPNSKFAKTLAT